jgi:uncharacterized phage protein (TIGR02218 family)
VTYIDTEKSIQDNKPIELYKFRRDAVDETFFYTSSNESIIFLGDIYNPVSISRGELNQTSNIEKATIDITIPFNTALVLQYVSEVIIDEFSVIIYRENAGGYAQIYSGILDAITVGEPMATINAISRTKALETDTLQIMHSIQCPYKLFDASTCKASSAGFTLTGTIDTINSTSITSSVFATKPDGWLIGGELIVNSRRRMILSHIGNNIIISPFLNASAGDSFEAFAGCGHNTDDCLNKFSNLDNFGGEPYIPTKDLWTRRVM